MRSNAFDYRPTFYVYMGSSDSVTQLSVHSFVTLILLLPSIVMVIVAVDIFIIIIVIAIIVTNSSTLGWHIVQGHRVHTAFDIVSQYIYI